MNRKSTLTRYGLGLVVSTFLLASSGGPSFNTVNAPGDGQYCGDCHTGGQGDASIILSGAPVKYAPGATYPLQLIILDPTAAAGGFQIVATNGSTNTQVGTFSVPAGTRTIAGTQRLTHSTPKVFSSGAAAWTFNWTAPSSGAPQNLQFYFAANGADLNGNASGDDGIWGASGLIPLPVQLTDFSASYLNEHSARLTWHTAMERDAETFIIERTTDHRNFETIGEVPAQGTSDEPSSYQFVDEKLGGATTYYYRLAQRDFDGTIHRYHFVSLRTGKGAVRVHFLDGMPALTFGNQLRFQLTTELDVASARLISVDGRVQGEAQIAEGDQEINLTHTGAASGLHLLQLFDAAGHLVHVEKVL